MKRKDISNILMALNATNDMGFKYSIGNKELNDKVKSLEALGKIKYDSLYKKWSHG
jgi:hypothetical protein